MLATASPPPLVSILTPTYERFPFLPFLARMLARQIYPLVRMEWIVMDDSEHADPTAAWFAAHPLHTQLFALRYVQCERLTIGAKRNRLKELAQGDLLIHMDDDDYYGTNYVTTVVSLFQQNRRAVVVGASAIYLVFPDDACLFRSGPFHSNHTCAGVMSYRRSYSNTHHFDDTATRAEESHFLNHFRTPVCQIAYSHNVYLVLVHKTNTVNKLRIRRRRTPLKWLSFLHHPDILMFYTGLCLTLHRRPYYIATTKSDRNTDRNAPSAESAESVESVESVAYHPSDRRGAMMMIGTTLQTLLHFATIGLLVCPPNPFCATSSSARGITTAIQTSLNIHQSGSGMSWCPLK